MTTIVLYGENQRGMYTTALLLARIARCNAAIIQWEPNQEITAGSLHITASEVKAEHVTPGVTYIGYNPQRSNCCACASKELPPGTDIPICAVCEETAPKSLHWFRDLATAKKDTRGRMR